MATLLFSSDPHQSLRMWRHLAGAAALLLFTLACIYFFNKNMFAIDKNAFILVITFLWIGFLVFTLLIRSGLNLRFLDPSLTMPQILWVTINMLFLIYLLNEWRGLILMSYFGLFSFGFFKLQFREFLSVALFVILGYILIILQLFINEPERIDIEFELLQLIAFSATMGVMLFTGSSITHLRQRSRLQKDELQEALRLNETLATTDELTGLYNRRYFMEKLSQQKALAERNDADFVLCYCDLDHFKQINDNFGHHTGDVVLQEFSEILKSSIREVDYAARIGGEEFVCLLVNTDIENAIKVAERIRESIENFNFNDIAPTLNATVSIGIANFRQFNTIQETLMSADNRMYLAKKSGRNQIIFTDETE